MNTRLASCFLGIFTICSYAMLANEASAQVKSLTLIFLDETGKPIPKTKLAYAGDPLPGLMESIGYVRGMLRVM